MRTVLALAAVGVLLVAGCATPKDSTGSSTASSPGGGQGFAPQQGTGRGSSGSVAVDVTWRACEAGFCAHAIASNSGGAVQISSICESPWLERMKDEEGRTVHPHESQATCLAYGRRAFAAGEAIHANFTWDGKLWSGSPEQARDAPEGGYTWTVVFWFEETEGGARREAAADLLVRIGET